MDTIARTGDRWIVRAIEHLSWNPDTSALDAISVLLYALSQVRP